MDRRTHHSHALKRRSTSGRFAARIATLAMVAVLLAPTASQAAKPATGAAETAPTDAGMARTDNLAIIVVRAHGVKPEAVDQFRVWADFGVRKNGSSTVFGTRGESPVDDIDACLETETCRAGLFADHGISRVLIADLHVPRGVALATGGTTAIAVRLEIRSIPEGTIEALSFQLAVGDSATAWVAKVLDAADAKTPAVDRLVRVTPATARVYVEDVPLAAGEHLLRRLTTGSYRVRAEAPKHTPTTSSYDVWSAEDGATSWDLELERAKGGGGFGGRTGLWIGIGVAAGVVVIGGVVLGVVLGTRNRLTCDDPTCMSRD